MSQIACEAIKPCKNGHTDRYANGRCRACANTRAREWMEKNPESRKKAANAYYARNKESYAAVRGERWIGWYYKNHEQNKLSRRVRQANRKTKSVGTFSVDDVEKIRSLQFDKCACCAKGLRKKGHIDHIIPLSKGGLNVARNLQLLCAFCNLSKKDKDPIDFMQQTGRLL